MKIKILAIAVTGILLSGCGNDDNGSFPSLSVQAYDPAIRGMVATAVCEDSTSEISSKTDDDGIANFTSLTVISAPETCKFTFVGGTGAVDMSNNISMTGVTYIIPKGLARLNAAAITATPISTLIAKTLGDDVTYNESTATQVMTDLGLGDLINKGDINVTEFLLDTANVMKKLETKSATAFSQLSAVTTVLTKVLKTDDKAASNEKVSVDSIAKASKDMAEQVIAKYSKYPKNNAGKNIEIPFVEAEINDITKAISEGKKPTITIPAAIETKPAERTPSTPPTPPTGGTGGSTGGTGGTGGIGA